MKCDRIQQDILLARAGELSAGGLEALRRHLDSCEECRRFSEDSEKLMSLARVSLSAAEPSATVKARILAAAGEETEGRVALFPAYQMRWALSAAAAILLACGFGILMYDTQPENSPGTLSAIALVIGPVEHLESANLTGDAGKDQELKALADHLLIMEGFKADEFRDVDVSGAGDEPLPTALQLRSIDAFELRRCV